MLGMRSIVLAVGLVALASAASIPLNLQQIPEQLKEIVPEEVKKFYEGLTEEDKAILKEVASNHAAYENEDQALEALKGKSEKLYNEAIKFRDALKTKIDSLKPEAKTFVESVIGKVRALKPKGDEKPDLKKLREVATGVINDYKALPEDAKANLEETFPQVAAFLKNEKFQAMASGFVQPKTPN